MLTLKTVLHLFCIFLLFYAFTFATDVDANTRVDTNTLTEIPMKRDKPKIILLYDDNTELFYQETYNSSAPVEINYAMEGVNTILKNSGSTLQFDWKIVKSDDNFIKYEDESMYWAKGIYDVSFEQPSYMQYQVNDVADLYLAIFSDEFFGKLGGTCILGIGFDGDDYKQHSPAWLDEKRVCHVSASVSNRRNSIVLAHEIAHLFGAQHDRYQMVLEGRETHDNAISYGYVDLENEFMTIMSYASKCIDAGVDTCRKLPLFSNPELIHQGNKMGVSENEYAASNVAKFLSYTGKDYITRFNKPAPLAINFTAEEISVSWEDVTRDYVITAELYKGNDESGLGIFEHIEIPTSEPSIVLPRLFDPYRHQFNDYRDWHNGGVLYTVWGVFKNNDVRRRVELGQFMSSPRFVNDYNPDQVVDFQLGLDTSSFLLPKKGESVSINITLAPEESSISNDNFFAVSDRAECIESQRMEELSGRCSLSPITKHLWYDDISIYGSYQPDWLSNRFDIKVTGSGINRTVTFTSKKSDTEWLEYAHYVYSDLVPKYDINNIQPYHMYQEKVLPVRIGFLITLPPHEDRRILGSSMITIDLSPLYTDKTILENERPIAAVSFFQNNSATNLVSKSDGKVVLDINLEGIDLETVNLNLDTELPYEAIDSDSSFVFDLTDVDPNTYNIGLNITEAAEQSTDHTLSFQTSLQSTITFQKNISLTVVDSLPTLSETNDSDNDGLNDLAEGIGDVDQNGSPNFLDSNTRPLGYVIGFDEQYISPHIMDYSLSLLVYSDFLKNLRKGLVKNALLTYDDLVSVYGNRISDPQFLPFTDYVSLAARLVNNTSSTTDVYVPLPIGIKIPPEAVLRRYLPETGWSSVSDSRLFSAKKTASGTCPPSYTNSISNYTKSMTEGDECVWVILDNELANLGLSEEIKDFGIFTFATPSKNNIPEISHIEDHFFDENKAVNISASVTDKDNDTLAYRWEQTDGLTVTLTGSNTNTMSFTTPNVSDDEVLTFKVFVSDGIAEAEQEFTVTIKNVDSNVDSNANNEGANDSGGGSMGWLLAFFTLFLLPRRCTQ